jgi:hypothetical protein
MLKEQTTGDGRRNERRGDFGWSVEGSSEIKAFWLAHVEFADPTTKVSGKISDSTAKALERMVADHADEVIPRPNLAAAVLSGSLKAFAVSENLGGGYLIVFASGIMNFVTIATERTSSTPAAEENGTSQRARSSQMDSPVDSRGSAHASWLSRIFSFGPSAKLAARLASNDDSTFIPALSEAVEYGPKGNDLGVRAMEAAMRIRAGRRKLVFYYPKFGELTGRSFDELADSPKMLERLASEKALLRDPCVSQNLMSACSIGHGDEGIRECIMKARDLGGLDQFYTFQLLYNHMLQTAKLAHARGARSWTEQISNRST